jgi:glycosyltransferase involved in cell wall biosynthesis
VLSLGLRMRRRGIDARVITPRVPDGPGATREEVNGLPVERIAYPAVRILGGLVLLSRLAARLIAHRHRYEVIHAHIGHNMAAVCALVGPLLGKPVMVKITGTYEMFGGVLDPRAGWVASLRRRALHRATRIQATSTRIRSLLVANGFDPARIVLLPNGVDVDRYAAGGPETALRQRLAGDASRVGIFVGRLVTDKRLDLLFEAWARVFAGRDDARLVLVGEGPLRAELEAQAARLGIAGQVVFAGHTDEVPAHLRAADFALLTSLGEGLSNALLEYMAASLPVVGSRVSGTEDFIEPGRTGWLFEPGNVDALAQCLRELAACEPAELRAMGGTARSRVVSEASLEAVTTRLLGLYGLEAAAP